MPYRRLPNTDQARLRALKTALEIGAKHYPNQIAYNQKLFFDLKGFVPQFEQALDQFNGSRSRQALIGKQLSEQFKITRLYVSHFIQVLNFCIMRNEIKAESRQFLGLDLDEKTVPELGTENQLIEWGDKVIKGEEQRMALGGTRIFNPSIAVVKVKYEKFLELYNSHKNLQITAQKQHDKVLELRDQADKMILQIWNETELRFQELPSEEKRVKCMEYGLIYFLRKHEKEKSMVEE